MIKTGRYIFNGLTVLSLMLCAYFVVTTLRARFLSQQLMSRMAAQFGGNGHIHDTYFRVRLFGRLVPPWFPVITTAVFPLLWLGTFVVLRMRPTIRQNLALCSCGYDLRATPGRCPECGKVL